MRTNQQRPLPALRVPAEVPHLGVASAEDFRLSEQTPLIFLGIKIIVIIPYSNS
jgi:hypothetical protein